MERISFHVGHLFVCGRSEAERIYKDFDIVISIGTLDDFPRGLLEDHPRHLRVEMDDLDDRSDYETVRKMGMAMPSPQHIRRILAFADEKVPTLVHCYAGASRSPASAMLIAIQHGFDMDEVVNAMDPSLICPNARILALGEEMLGVTGLSEAVRKRLDWDPGTGESSCDLEL